MKEALSKNMNLVSRHLLNGFGGMGEGISIQITNDGRRILWMAHVSAPKNFSAVDVSDLKNPRLICQTDLPHQNVRSNSLEVCGDRMAVAYQTNKLGEQPAGIEMFDISMPDEPKSIGFFDTSGPKSKGVHQVWYVDGEFIHCAGADANFDARLPEKDYQFYQIIDARDPSSMREVGRWWMPGQCENDIAPPMMREPKYDVGFRPHNTNVYPERPDRAYVGYIDGGAFTLDISDMSCPRMIANWNPSPPFPGFVHTVMPMFEWELLVVSHECNKFGAEDWPKITWLLDNRYELNPVPLAILPLPPFEEFGGRPGRFGAHNLHENRPGPSFRSEMLVIGNYFNAGIRVHDISNPFRPEEVAYYVPEDPENSRIGEIQINDVYVDENQIVYAMDRFGGGLYIIEMDL